MIVSVDSVFRSKTGCQRPPTPPGCSLCRMIPQKPNLSSGSPTCLVVHPLPTSLTPKEKGIKAWMPSSHSYPASPWVSGCWLSGDFHCFDHVAMPRTVGSQNIGITGLGPASKGILHESRMPPRNFLPHPPKSCLIMSCRMSRLPDLLYLFS